MAVQLPIIGCTYALRTQLSIRHLSFKAAHASEPSGSRTANHICGLSYSTLLIFGKAPSSKLESWSCRQEPSAVALKSNY